MSSGLAVHNRCPPGGQEGVNLLAKILHLSPLRLNADCGLERPRPRAVIREMECIGCTLCIQACPVDAIVGAPKQLHFVISERCTGCDLCVPPCPVDCITMLPVNPINPDETGWNAWSPLQAQASKDYFEARKLRLEREKKDLLKRQYAKAQAKLKVVQQEKPSAENLLQEQLRKKEIIAAAMARAKAQISTRDLK